jgi:hypothetical protein
MSAMRALLCVVVLAWGCGDIVKTNVELARCTNGLDDEGPPDDLIDCEDPQCGDITTCVPTTDERAGIVVDEDEACPEGFEGGETLIHRGLRPGTCEGCGCDVGTTECAARLWTYVDSNDCFGDVGLSGGTQLGIVVTATCSENPIYYTDPGGIRAEITATGTCSSSGTPIPAAADWTDTKKFCRVSLVGNGCTADHACVPKTSSPVAQCALVDGLGADACTGFGMTETDWYTGVDDQRTCGACFCSPVGGDCNDVQVQVGIDYSCGVVGALIGDGAKKCFGAFPDNAPYSPPVELVGTPTPATGCTATSTPSGTITPTGAQTLCCAPN